MNGKSHSKHTTAVLGLLCLALLIILPAALSRRSENCTITITAPSDENGPVTPGHGFFVAGEIKGRDALPEGASLRVSLFDKSGKELRFAESSRKDEDRIDRFCDAFFYYADKVDPARSSVRAREFPFLIVDDSPQSLKNANIKCWFSDNGFNAFIPYATDTAHGLLMDDGIGYTDAAGNAYDALPNGDYTLAAVLKDRKGRTLAAAKKGFSIQPAKTAILCRFHPDEHYEKMKKFAEENDLSMNIDYLPGYYKDSSGNDRGGLRAMFIGGDCALYNGSHVTMFEYLASPASSSLIIELPFIEKYFNVDDPEKFKACYYDIGEPSLRAGERRLGGRIVAAAGGDKLCLCRADIMKGAEEGRIDFDTLRIRSTDTDFSDGISLAAAEDHKLAISGVIVPHQLNDEEILFDPARNKTGLLNRVENIVYLVRSGAETKQYEKPVFLVRKFRDGSEHDSVLEFYHVFSKDEIASGIDYEITLYGIDKKQKTRQRHIGKLCGQTGFLSRPTES